MKTANNVTAENLSLLIGSVFWIIFGVVGWSFLAISRPLFGQNIVLNFLLCFFLISLVRQRLFLPGRFGAGDFRGKNAVYISLIALIILLGWGIYFNYFSFLNLKYYAISFALMLAYVYVLIELFYKIGNYLNKVGIK